MMCRADSYLITFISRCSPIIKALAVYLADEHRQFLFSLFPCKSFPISYDSLIRLGCLVTEPVIKYILYIFAIFQLNSLPFGPLN
jgi:hypothetical protein